MPAMVRRRAPDLPPAEQVCARIPRGRCQVLLVVDVGGGGVVVGGGSLHEMRMLPVDEGRKTSHCTLFPLSWLTN